MEHTISRRGFLRTGFAGGAAVAAAAASGSALAADLYRPGTYSAKAPGIGGDVDPASPIRISSRCSM